MYQPPREGQREADGTLLGGCLACLSTLARCLCCLGEESNGGEGGQRLLSTQQESAASLGLGIEASASPPRLPRSEERGALLKGQGPASSSSGGLQTAASPPMPPPFFPPAARHKHGGSGSPGGDSPAAGASPKAGKQQQQDKDKGGSKLSLFEDDDDMCPTCLEPYTEDNPKVLTRCSHHFHLPCLYEWLERSQTCPVCDRSMQFEELL